MRGRIYTDQRCPICDGAFQYDERRRGLFCPEHSEQRATARFRVQFGRRTRQRFATYLEAERFLDGLRWEVDQGTYDPRDYRKNFPLGFSSLADKWLQVKKLEVKPRSFNNLRNYMERAKEAWGQMNVKSIGFGELEDFLVGQETSDKTKANMKSCLHTFFTWIRKREKIPMPEFPEIKFQLGWRQTISKETQQALIDEVWRISKDVNPRIWLGVKWLATYISIRPGELIRIKEKDLDIQSGYIFIPDPKEKKPKVVPMIDEDIELVSQLPRGLPNLPFFRHPAGLKGVVPGEQFGPRYLYKWWKKACENLGVEGVDLYGGTRHSTALALRQFKTPEQIRRATMHSTNKAFERYFRVELEEVKDVYSATRVVSKRCVSSPEIVKRK